MPKRHNCQARQYGDQMICAPCGLNWDVNDPEPPENCYPAEGGCGDWEVLDRRGRPAPWLERKLNDRERSRIDDEVFEHMEGGDDY